MLQYCVTRAAQSKDAILLDLRRFRGWRLCIRQARLGAQRPQAWSLCLNPSLTLESEKLARSWAQQSPQHLREYLVSGVQDPRVNLQSILSRHFLIREATSDRFSQLMGAEYRFAATIEWLLKFAATASDPELPAAVLHALRLGADNAEGLEIPRWLVQVFRSLPLKTAEAHIPNYIEEFLNRSQLSEGHCQSPEAILGTFCRLWRECLAQVAIDPTRPRVSVLEPACGSANDYRFFRACGLERLMDYTGSDLSPANIQNARELFPDARFEIGNVFELGAPEQGFELCVVHDLFEHLSVEGLETAVREISRVTRRGICASFFQMDEIPEHRVQQVEEYHWNRLSLARTRELFAAFGFTGQAIHVGTFAREKTGCAEFHNPFAYTLLLRR